MEGFLTLLGTRANNSVDGTDGGDVRFGADAISKEPIADLPGKYAWVLPFVVFDLVDNFWRSYFGLAASNNARFNCSCFVVSTC